MNKKITSNPLDFTRVIIEATTITITVGGTYTLEDLKQVLSLLEESNVPVMSAQLEWNHEIFKELEE